MTRNIVCFGECLEYELQRKKVKNLNMRVRAGGEIYVSAPASAPLSAIDKFVTDKIDFIHSARERILSREQREAKPLEYVSGEKMTLFGRTVTLNVIKAGRSLVSVDGDRLMLAVRAGSTRESRERTVARASAEWLSAISEKIARRIYPLFSPLGIVYPEIRVRSMKSRWGSCHTKKHIITLSTMLTSVPTDLIEYVLMHEFCHFIYADHSPKFHNEMTKRMPDWKERRRRLKQ